MSSLRDKIHEIIFEADTKAGKAFDIALIISIVLSVVAVMLDSVAAIQEQYGEILYFIEWFFTIGFSIEYVLRLYSVTRPIYYARSFFGLIDLFAILPTYLSIFFPGTQYLLVIRVLRVLRIFRVLKLVQYFGEAQMLLEALASSRRKVVVFLSTVMMLTVILGALIYLIEGPENGFTSIPRSIYWAIVTMTTVGYGDITPVTNIGQFIAAIAMITGYSILAVPTGIFTVEMVQSFNKKLNTRCCTSCGSEGHEESAMFCKDCGEKLD